MEKRKNGIIVISDIDGVLCNLIDPCFDFIEHTFGISLKQNKDFKIDDFKKIMKRCLTKKQWCCFEDWIKEDRSLYDHKTLKSYPNTVSFFVNDLLLPYAFSTARLPKLRDLTSAWLEKEGLLKKSIGLYMGDNKSQSVLSVIEMGYTSIIFIDDSPSVLKKLKENFVQGDYIERMTGNSSRGVNLKLLLWDSRIENDNSMKLANLILEAVEEGWKSGKGN